jgi:ATP-binding cassette subfamily B protein
MPSLNGENPWDLGRGVGGMGRALGLRHAFDAPEPPLAQPLDRRVLGRALACFRPYRLLTVLAGLALGAGALLGLLPPLLVRGLIDHGIPAGQATGSAVPLLLYVAGLVLAPLAVGLIGLGQQYLLVRISQGILFDLRNRLFRHLQAQSLRFFTTTRAGERVARVSDDVAAVEGAVKDTLVEVTTNLVTVAGTLAVLFAVSWPLALAACATLPVFLVPARRVGRWRRRLVTQTQERQAELLALLQDLLNVGGFLLMRLFGRTDYEARRIDEHNRALLDLRIRQGLAGRSLLLVVTVLGAAGPALVYWYGGLLVIRGTVTIGTVVAFVAYLANLYRPTTRLASVYVDVQAALGIFQRIFASLDLEPEVRDRPGAAELETVRGAIRFEDVTFAYRPGQRPALAAVSFAIEPGQLVALVGPSGAGKTTVTYLVPRFYDPQGGRVLVDGRDVSTATQASLAAQVGMVTQDTFLFHASIRDNLLYARPQATPAEVEAACRTAHIHDFLASLPDGYDTIVGERGVKLSGGERQRVAIARALLKDPRILILDEATSALDSSSERLIQEALAPLMRGRTTLAIAHRLSTILAADRILVLDAGRLVESGTHAELLRQGGLYARLYREQFERQAGPAVTVHDPPGSPRVGVCATTCPRRPSP